MMKTILCDVDGVLADCIGGVCKVVETIKPEHLKHWDLSKSLNWSDHQMAMAAMGLPGFCAKLEMYAGAEDFLWKLQEEGAVYAVTAPFNSETWERERRTWLKQYMHPSCVLSVPSTAKPLVRGDILIEDHPGTCFRWLENNPAGCAVLIDRPWNQETADEYCHHDDMYRAKSYGEALRIVRDLL